VQHFEIASGQSLAASFETSTTFTIKTVHNIAVNIDCNSVTDNTGTFAIQHRITDGGRNQSEWATLTLSTTPALADGDDTFLVNLNQLPPGEIRVKFTADGGTPDGTCDITLSAISIGG
jgi:Ca2+-dependent lipid-binding protein